MNAVAPPYAAPSKERLNASARRPGDRYLAFLGFVLLGYALFGRGFANVGVPPLFIGEIALISGLIISIRSSSFFLIRHSWVTTLLIAFMAWSAFRTIPYIGEYGMDAFRDGVLWGYALFAFIVGGLLLREGDRLRDWLLRYQKGITYILMFSWMAFAVSRIMDAQLPEWPGRDVKIIDVKQGDVLTHLGGITAFIIVGMRRLNFWTVLGLMVSFGAVIASSRSGMLAFAVAVLAATALFPPKERLIKLSIGLLILASLAVIIDPKIPIPTSGRTISVEQITDNILSIIGVTKVGDPANLSETAGWRMNWWGIIIDYTFAGPHFWLGQGYGINLNVVDGTFGSEDLRSPHNASMSVLARSGVPGFFLWLAVTVGWFVNAMIGWYHARLKNDRAWMGLWAFLIAYALAIHVNASFDVFLEGPMGGIWYWSIFGTGIAARIIQQRRPDLLHDTGVETQPGRERHAPQSTHNRNLVSTRSA